MQSMFLNLQGYLGDGSIGEKIYKEPMLYWVSDYIFNWYTYYLWSW